MRKSILFAAILIASCGGGNGDSLTSPTSVTSTVQPQGTSSASASAPSADNGSQVGNTAPNQPSGTAPTPGAVNPTTSNPSLGSASGAANGGSSSSGTPPSTSASTPPPTATEPTPQPTATATTTPIISASLVSAPAAGIVRKTDQIIVNGVGMQNVELLPATGYMPRYGTFLISAGAQQATFTIGDSIPHGVPTVVRVSAWDVPAGGTGREIVVMEPRAWVLVESLADMPYQNPADLQALINDPALRTPQNIRAAVDKHAPPDLRALPSNLPSQYESTCINSGFSDWVACHIYVQHLIDVENNPSRPPVFSF